MRLIFFFSLSLSLFLVKIVSILSVDFIERLMECLIEYCVGWLVLRAIGRINYLIDEWTEDFEEELKLMDLFVCVCGCWSGLEDQKTWASGVDHLLSWRDTKWKNGRHQLHQRRQRSRAQETPLRCTAPNRIFATVASLRPTWLKLKIQLIRVQ